MEVIRSLSSEDYIFELKNNGNLLKNNKLPNNIKPAWSLKGHNNSIEEMHIIDKNKFVTVSHDCFVSLWTVDNKKKIHSTKLDYPILCSSYYFKKKLLCVGMTNRNDNICILDMDKNKVIEILNSKCSSIFCMNYFEEDKITYGSNDGSICLIDLHKKKNIYRYEEISDCLNCGVYNTDHNIHIFGTYNGNLLFFDFKYTLPYYQTNSLHSKYSINTLVSYDNYLYSGSSDCLIKKFDLRFLDDKKPLEIFIGHTSPVRFLSFSNNLNYFCSSSDNGSIKLWKTDNNFEKNIKGSSLSLNPSAFLPMAQGVGTKVIQCNGRKISKNFLELNKNTINNNRSSSIRSEYAYRKSSLFLKNSHLKKEQQTGTTDRKRTLTPNVATINEKIPSVFLKNGSFNALKIKNRNKEKDSLNHLKSNANSKNIYQQVNETKKKNLKIQSELNAHISLLYSGYKHNDARIKRKINLNKPNEVSKYIDNSLNKLNNNNIKILLQNDDIVENSTKPTTLKNSILSMLNHRSRVSSIKWIDDMILSTSWDQTIKCWYIKKYVME